ncbi:hypothetical protein [Chelativorans sp. AA-79]|uniref:hypothetical protein n=1 Tax=Chelativorans sp. AA-79 TaxID=3028735 RepID=UPI0023F9ADBF|nr:hypothetical protein [Chelativorans sp. AA-79]WEX09577.1 hypothetical protein PVE73_00970 [Chelativorans sp. AA-79]
MGTARYALFSGTAAGLAALLAVMASAMAEGRGVLEPVSATSHWLHGDSAGRTAKADASHTGVGLVTNAASAMFWALPFAFWASRGGPRSLTHLLCGASVLSALAALLDYGLLPRRLSPGWELAVSKRAVAGAFAAMAAGLAAGAWAAQRRH